MAGTDSVLRVETSSPPVVDRRLVLKAGVLGGALLAADALFARRALGRPALLAGATGAGRRQRAAAATRASRRRIVARSNQLVTGTTYKWHRAPDGGCVFGDPGGNGWAYVSNSELADRQRRRRHDPLRPAAAPSSTPAASSAAPTATAPGGHTPWGTWLSCEEVDQRPGLGGRSASGRPVLGRPSGHGPVQPRGRRGRWRQPDRVHDGGRRCPACFYRYRYDKPRTCRPACSRRRRCENGVVTLAADPDPSAATSPTRKQVPSATRFNGRRGHLVRAAASSTSRRSSDDRVWAYHIGTDAIQVVYDWTTNPNPVLRGVDNIAVLDNGDVFVCEDQSVLDPARGPEDLFARAIRRGVRCSAGPSATARAS